MGASYQELFRFLDQLGEKLEALTAIQNQKTEAVMHDDLAAVNECMKQEQVISLSLRSMEKKREQLLSALGLEGKPVSALPAACPPELRPEAREVVERLLGKYQICRSASLVCRNTLEINLHQIEKIVAELGGSAHIPALDPQGGQMTDFRA